MLLRQLLDEPTQDRDLLPWMAQVETRHASRQPLERAFLGGAGAAGLAGAFAVAYRAALRQLVPTHPAAALAVTESQGNHPRALRTAARSEGTHVHIEGEKVWTTLANRAETLLVAAVEGERDGRPAIGVYAVPASASGVSLTPMPPTPFVPEIPHFAMTLDVRVPAENRVDGDGWADLVKPFRTVEDLFVTAALAGLGFRRREPADWAAVITGIAALGDADPSSAQTHLALHGLMERSHELAQRLAEDDAVLARDLALLRIAGKARATRHQRALQQLGIS